MWQFLVDSVYDWFHRHDKFGQSDFEGWWLVRRVEFLRLIDLRSKDDQTYTQGVGMDKKLLIAIALKAYKRGRDDEVKKVDADYDEFEKIVDKAMVAEQVDAGVC